MLIQASAGALDGACEGVEKGRMRILILGGTTEAYAIAEALGSLPDLDLTLSFAGRTTSMRRVAVSTRTGGFGGASGLATWMREHGSDLLVDATHPFAATISANAASACAQTGIRLLALRRLPWKPTLGDCWIEVDTIEAAAGALDRAGDQRVLVTIGRQELAGFLAAAPARHLYLVRAIELLEGLVPHDREVVTLSARGPFSFEREYALMNEARIELLVTKNSGGEATAAKIGAARALNIPVVVVRQPAKPLAHDTVATPEEAVAWIAAHRGAPTERGV